MEKRPQPHGTEAVSIAPTTINMSLRRKIGSFIKHLPIIGKHYPAFRAFIEDKREELIHYYDEVFADYSGKKPLETKFGFVMHIGHGRYHKMMAQSAFEVEETDLILSLLKDVDVYVDVGANLGFYVFLARSVGKQVVAIEPQIKNVKVLLASLAANNYLDVEVYPIGLADKPGIAKLYGASSTGASLIEGWAAQPGKIKTIIPLTTLDVIAGHRFAAKRLLIKIDVEGMEYGVLQGAVEVVKHTPRPKWILEITLNEFHPDKINPAYQKTFEFFWRNGYEIYTANSARRRVMPEDVARWIKNKKTDFDVINYFAE